MQRDGRQPIERRVHSTDSRITDRYHLYGSLRAPRIGEGAVGVRRCEQRAKARQRSETPDLLAAVRLRKRLRVARERPLEMAAAFAAAPMRVTRGRSGRVGDLCLGALEFAELEILGRGELSHGSAHRPFHLQLDEPV